MKKYTKKTIEYYNKIAENYFKSDAAMVIKDKIDKFISLLQGTKVLDVACGPGHDTDYLTREGFNCIGIDLSRRMIKIAKNIIKENLKLWIFLI